MKMTLGNKLALCIILFSLVASVPFAILSFMAITTARHSFIEDRFSQLQTASAIKRTQIEVYFQDRKNDLEGLIDTIETFKKEEKKIVNHHEMKFYSNFIKKFGYYDLFLINPDGYCFFTVAKEADYQTNLANGKYKDTNLGQLIRTVLETKKYGIVDFKPYAPSNDEPAAFIAQPIINNGEVELVVALQLSVDRINEIMHERSGLGSTGETYLVGPDHLMRSDSYLDPVHHSIKASFADPAKGRIDTDGVKRVFSGKMGKDIIIDYNGHRVLSVYEPVKMENIQWALLAEIDEDEVISKSLAAKELIKKILSIGVFSTIVIVIVILLSTVIIRNLTKVLKELIQGLNDGADQVSAASTEVSSASQSLAEGSSEQAASIEETSSSLEEMSSMTVQNTENASQANKFMAEANDIVNQADNSMKELTVSIDEISKASQETHKIIKTIDEIAFQTNLLALNAAVEAARAGNAGAGFAVVADEVRNLAMRAAEAAKNTATLIEETVKRVQVGSEIVIRTNDAFSKMADSSSKVGNLVSEISAASKEQSEGINQINKAVTEMDKVVQRNAANAEENASASEQMTAQAVQMKKYVEKLVALVGQDRSKLHENSA